jgi:hypothetical protein
MQALTAINSPCPPCASTRASFSCFLVLIQPVVVTANATESTAIAIFFFILAKDNSTE